MIVLVDTNVLLDVLQKREPHAAAAARVWQLAEEGALTAYVSAISFNNIYYIARKQVGNARAMDAVGLVRRVFRFAPLDESAIDRAIAAGQSDFEDAIQAACAEAIGAAHIVTRDPGGFAAAVVPAVTSQELLALLEP